MKTKHILAIVFGGIMVISVFFPWATGKASSSVSGYSGGGSFSATVSGISMTTGVIGLLLGGAGITLAIIKATRRFAIIAGGLAIIDVVAAFISMANAGGSSKASYGGYSASASASVEPAWGIFIYAIFAIAFLVMSIILVRNPN